MNTPHSRLSRRRFIQHTAAATTGLAAASSLAAQRGSAQEPELFSFQSQWSRAHDRVWLGPEFWANPLQDWRIAAGRIECVNAAPNRTAQKAGFKFVKTHMTVPGTLNYRQAVTQWVIER